MEMKNAYYIDNIVTISGSASFVWNISHTNQLLEITSKRDILDSSGSRFIDYIYTYTVPSIGDNEKFGETMFDDVIVSDGDTINVECILRYDETRVENVYPITIFQLVKA